MPRARERAPIRLLVGMLLATGALALPAAAFDEDLYAKLLEQHTRAVEDEAGTELERFLDRVDVDPQTLDEMEERKTLFEQLQRKYQRDLAGLLSLEEDLEQRLQRHRLADDELQQLAEDCASAEGELVGALLELKKMIKEGRCDGANRYVENFDWYKANQKKVIKNWNMPDYNW